jgi:curved DNA-binding protein
VKDYYNTLGVERTASADDIKRAYRSLAMKHHPDRGGDISKFQEIQEAYAVLSDAAKKQAYDNPAAGRFGSAGSTHFDFDAIFDMFGADLRSARRPPPRVSIWISLADVMTGGPRTIALQVGSAITNVEIHIPLGVNDNDSLRYPGLAPGGQDLVVNYRIKPDAVWRVEGTNLLSERLVDIWDLILGCEITFSDVLGNELTMTVPSETQPGTVLRARGRGLPVRQLPSTSVKHPPGDLLIKLQGKLITPVDNAIKDAIRKSRGQ